MLLIALAGPSGSGKSTVAERIVKETGGVILSLDHYYKSNDHLSMEARKQLNYDSPDAIDFELFKKHIGDLKSNMSVERPVYDFTQHTRSKHTIRIDPCELIIIEGIFALHPSIADVFTYRFFLKTALETCAVRRMTRDIVERGRDPQSVCDQLTKTVFPSYYEYIAPTEKFAHYTIHWDGNKEQELRGMVMLIKGELGEK